MAKLNLINPLKQFLWRDKTGQMLDMHDREVFTDEYLQAAYIRSQREFVRATNELGRLSREYDKQQRKERIMLSKMLQCEQVAAERGITLNSLESSGKFRVITNTRRVQQLID